MISRFTRVEFLRGTGAPLTVGSLAVLPSLLLRSAEWAGNWAALALAVRDNLMTGWPMLVAAGAWVGGRAHRRKTHDLMRSMPKAPWMSLAPAWAVLTTGAVVAALRELREI